jgi:hypothetical protein
MSKVEFLLDINIQYKKDHQHDSDEFWWTHMMHSHHPTSRHNRLSCHLEPVSPRQRHRMEHKEAQASRHSFKRAA